MYKADNAASTESGAEVEAKNVLIETLNLKVRKTNCSFEFVLCAIGAFVKVYIVLRVGRNVNFNRFSDFPCGLNCDSLR
jgi:hypothetical protein